MEQYFRAFFHLFFLGYACYHTVKFIETKYLVNLGFAIFFGVESILYAALLIRHSN